MTYTVTSSLPDPKGAIAGTYSTKNYTKDQFAVTRKTANETVYTSTEADLGVPCTIRVSRQNVNNVYSNIDTKINATNQLANKQGSQVLVQINDILTYTPESSAGDCCAERKYAPLKCNLVFRVPNDSGITPTVLLNHVNGILNALVTTTSGKEGDTMLNWAKGSVVLPFDM